MSCPYDEILLDYWDGVNNPMGDNCYECEEWDCEHNFNIDNPNDDWEKSEQQVQDYMDWKFRHEEEAACCNER